MTYRNPLSCSGHSRRTSSVELPDWLPRPLVAFTTSSVFRAGNQLTAEEIRNGRLKQSMAYWCFNVAGKKWDIQQQAKVARQLGCVSVELVEPQDFPVLQRNDLICALTPNGMPGAPFAKGLNNRSVSR